MIYLYAALGGILSGVLNTLASSGSAVTLPLLVWLGVTPTVANATNRLGIVTGALTSTLVFHRNAHSGGTAIRQSFFATLSLSFSSGLAPSNFLA